MRDRIKFVSPSQSFASRGGSSRPRTMAKIGAAELFIMTPRTHDRLNQSSRQVSVAGRCNDEAIGSSTSETTRVRKYNLGTRDERYNRSFRCLRLDLGVLIDTQLAKPILAIQISPVQSDVAVDHMEYTAPPQLE
jgi:hypothetical protein